MVVEYLTRCVDRLRYLRKEDSETFENAGEHYRDRHGEDPLRGWEVRLHAMVDVRAEAFQDTRLNV
jgi:hypothetical protein